MDTIESIMGIFKRKAKTLLNRKTGGKMDKEHLEKRFGVIAIEKGFIKPEQLLEALNIQVMEDIEHKEHRPIGRILLELGHVTEPQIDEVLNLLWEKALKEKGLVQDRIQENDQ